MTTWKDVVIARKNYKQVLETYAPGTGFTMDSQVKENLRKTQDALYDQLCLDWGITREQLEKESRSSGLQLSAEAEKKYKELAEPILMALVATF